MTTALVTGVSGQDGSYLAEFLLARGYRVVGSLHHAGRPRPSYFASLESKIELHALEVCDSDAVYDLIGQVKPDEVYHLAAESRVGASWEDPVASASVAGMGTLHVLEGVRRQAPHAKVVVAGSCEVFGRQPPPQNEDTPHAPLSPYGAGKSFAQHMTTLYRRRFGLFSATAILFNHESPRRSPSFVSRKIAAGVARIARGQASRLTLGNVEVVRDWAYAGDTVEAMWRMLRLDTPQDFVIGTGVGHSVKALCDACFRAAGLEADQFLTIDQTLIRRDDAPSLVADPSRARERLGWTPTVDFDTLVRMLVAAELDPLPA